MNRSPNLHSKFFSSLKQVEKRLKLDNVPPQPPETVYASTESLSSPIFLHQIHHQAISNQISNIEFSETPCEFLSNSIDFPQTQQNPLLETPQNVIEASDQLDDGDVDEIGLLIGLLGLSVNEGDEPNSDLNASYSCHCEGGFYEKIAGVKGPKCKKEAKRLEGWIRHFREKRIEPLRMAHLLLSKAALLSGDGVGFEGLEVPSTVEEYLQIDPPVVKAE